MSLLTLPAELLQAVTAELTPADVRALRLLNRQAFTVFANPHYCAFLLRHFFPFSPETLNPQPTAYDAFNALCMRLHRLHSQSWTQTLDLVFPPAAHSAERVYPGFHVFCPRTGALVTVESSLEHRTLEIAIRWLGEGGRCVLIPAPLELGSLPREDTGSPVGGFMPRCPPEIYFHDGRVLLVYPRDSFGGLVSEGVGSLALLLDGKTDGRTLWSALFNTPIYAGVDSNDVQERRLAPVFNSHYVAFLTALSPTGTLAIARLPLTESASEPQETISASLPIRPDNIWSLAPDRAGKVLLVGEVFPSHENLHRVVLVDARSGNALRAFHIPIAPAFAGSPRDWSFDLTPSETELLIFASPRNSGYRAALCGQVAVFPLSGERPKIRYLLSPGTLGSDNYHAEYDAELNLIVLLPGDGSRGSSSSSNVDPLTPNTPRLIESATASLLSYTDLALDSSRAGSGEIANRYNSRRPHFLSTLEPPSVPILPPSTPHSLRFGKSWVYLRSHIPSTFETAVHLLRLSPASDFLPTLPRIASRNSVRSATGLSGVSSPMGGQTVVDAEELAKRLKAMAEGGSHDRRGIVGEREKGEVAWEHGGFDMSASGFGGAVISNHPGATGFRESMAGVKEAGKGVVEKVEDALRRAKSEKSRRVKHGTVGVDAAPDFAAMREEAGYPAKGRVERSKSYDPESMWGWFRRSSRKGKAE